MVSYVTSNTVDQIGRKITWQGVVRAMIEFILFISNEDTDDIIRIVESLERSGLLTDNTSETVKDQIKKQEGGFFGGSDDTYGCFNNSTYDKYIDTSCGSLLINPITGKKVRRAGKGQEDGILTLLPLPLMFQDISEGG